MTRWPAPGKLISEYLASFLGIRNQIAGTPEAISDVACKTHIFTSLPEVFEVTLKIQQNRPDATGESIIDALKEVARIRIMKTTPDTATDAFYTLTGSRRGVRTRPCGGRGYGPGSGNWTWCTFCNNRSHSLERLLVQGKRRSGRQQCQLPSFPTPLALWRVWSSAGRMPGQASGQRGPGRRSEKAEGRRSPGTS